MHCSLEDCGVKHFGAKRACSTIMQAEMIGLETHTTGIRNTVYRGSNTFAAVALVLDLSLEHPEPIVRVRLVYFANVYVYLRFSLLHAVSTGQVT